jgi:hypothetical protein
MPGQLEKMDQFPIPSKMERIIAFREFFSNPQVAISDAKRPRHQQHRGPGREPRPNEAGTLRGWPSIAFLIDALSHPDKVLLFPLGPPHGLCQDDSLIRPQFECLRQGGSVH